MTSARDATRRFALLLGIAVLTGCAAPRQPTEADPANWSGRLALQIDSEPPQSLATGFELSGSSEAGELVLTSPLGTSLAAVRWRPGQAELQQGAHITRYDGLIALTNRLAGAALPVAALFDWLRGTPTASDGWTVDLSHHAQGRITAQRHQPPAPAALLRIVFQP